MNLETYVATICLVGGHFQSLRENLFSAAVVSFDGIEVWLQHRFFSHDHDNENNQILKSSIPESADLYCKNIESQIGFHGTLTQSVSRNPAQWTHTGISEIKITPGERQNVEWFIIQIGRIHNLASLCFCIMLPIRYMRLVSGEKSFGHDTKIDTYAEIIFDHRLAYKRDDTKAEQPMLFAGDLLSHNPHAFSKWFEEYDVIEPAMDLFFEVLASGLGSRDHHPVDVVFMLATQAIEVLDSLTDHNGLMAEQQFIPIKQLILAAIPPHTPKNVSEKIKGTMQWANEPSLRQRVKRLVESAKDVFGKAPLGMTAQYIDRLVKTRNYLTHYNHALKSESFELRDRYFAAQRLKVLLLTLLFRRIGIPPEIIREGLARNFEFAQIPGAGLTTVPRQPRPQRCP